MGKNKDAAKTPTPPDPQQLIQQQGNLNTNTFAQVLGANRVNQVTPFGSTTFGGGTGPGGLIGQTQTTTLTPGAQQQVSNQQQLGSALSGQALSLLGGGQQTPRAGSFTAGGQQTPRAGSFTAGGLQTSKIPPPGSTAGGFQAPPQSQQGGGGLQLPGFSLNGLPQLSQGINNSALSPQGQPVNLGGLTPQATGINPAGIGQQTRGVDTGNLTQVAGIDDFSAQRDKIAQSLFGQSKALLEPGFADARERTNQTLANRGFNLERSKGATRELNRLDTQQNQTLNSAATDAVRFAGQEQGRLFGQSLAANQNQFGQGVTNAGLNNNASNIDFSRALSNAGLANNANQTQFNQQFANAGLQGQNRQAGIAQQLANAGLAQQAQQTGIQNQLLQSSLPSQNLALLQQLQPQLPFQQPGGIAQGQQAPVDALSAVFGSNNAALNAAKFQQSKNASALGGITDIFGAVAPFIFSDRRLKNITKVIGNYHGLPVYTWEWNAAANKIGLKGHDQGFMADEVHAVVPDAVFQAPDGFLRIDTMKFAKAFDHATN